MKSRVTIPNKAVRIMQVLFRKTFSLIFVYSIPITLLTLLLGICLDYFYKEQIFQRFGALIVGYAIMHYTKERSLRLTYDQATDIVTLHSKVHNYLDLPSIEVLMTLNMKEKVMLSYISSMSQVTLESTGASNQDELLKRKRELAIETITLAFEAKDRRDDAIFELRNIERKEMYLAVLGTIVWAFGDWTTNILFHCDWQLNCW